MLGPVIEDFTETAERLRRSTVQVEGPQGRWGLGRDLAREWPGGYECARRAAGEWPHSTCGWQDGASYGDGARSAA